MRFVNPYDGIDWDDAVLVRGITHEHIYQKSQLKIAYDRGIRWFACVNYFPAVSAAPDLSGWNGTFLRWDYYDVSNAFPTGGVDGGNTYTHGLALAKVPQERLVDGFVMSYLSTPLERTYEKLSSGSWNVISEADLDDEMSLVEDTYSVVISPFVDKDGITVDPAELPALGNAEHGIFKRANGTTASSHFNVLGNMFGEACVWTKPWYPRSFVNAHPIYNLSDIKLLFTTDLQFSGKYFGTLNHNYNLSELRSYLEAGNGLFKAMELFNQAFTKEGNQMFRDAYDALLREGNRLFAVAVADWQDEIEILGYDGQDMTHYVKECDFNRGCNVLVMPSDYDSLSKSGKTEAGLDAYLSGAYFASGLGNYHPTELSASGKNVHLGVNGNPSKVRAITSKRTVELANTDSISVNIQPGETYIRFEVFYADHDFIFTNPIWIEDNWGKNTPESILLLL